MLLGMKLSFFYFIGLSNFNLYANTGLDGSVTLSVCLFVRYRNLFPIVQFQNQAHIQNPHDPAEICKTMGRRRHPKFSFLSFYRRRRRLFPKWAPMAPSGAAPPEGDRNPAENGCFLSIYQSNQTLQCAIQQT